MRIPSTINTPSQHLTLSSVLRHRGIHFFTPGENTALEVFQIGEWRLCERSGWPDNQSCRNVLTWCWVKDDERCLIVINFRQEAAQARVRVPWDELRGKQWRLNDVLSGESYDRSGDEMRDAGLYVELGPWKCHLFQVGAL